MKSSLSPFQLKGKPINLPPPRPTGGAPHMPWIGQITICHVVTVCKRDTGHDGDTYRRFVYWDLTKANEKHPQLTKGSSGGLWTHKRTVQKVVWDGKRWREIGNAINPK